MVPGVLCLALAGGLRWFGPGLLLGLRAQWEASVAGGAIDVIGPGAGVLRAFGVVALLLVMLAALGGRLAWVDVAAGRGLGVGSQRGGGCAGRWRCLCLWWCCCGWRACVPRGGAVCRCE